MSTQNWAEKFDDMVKTLPAAGTIIRGFGDESIGVHIDLQEPKEIDGKRVPQPPFIYAKAYVPCLVGEPLGWFGRTYDDTSAHGVTLTFLPRAREMIIRHRGLSKNKTMVFALKVVRASKSGKSLLVEIAELNKKHKEATNEEPVAKAS